MAVMIAAVILWVVVLVFGFMGMPPQISPPLTLSLNRGILFSGGESNAN